MSKKRSRNGTQDTKTQATASKRNVVSTIAVIVTSLLIGIALFTRRAPEAQAAAPTTWEPAKTTYWLTGNETEAESFKAAERFALRVRALLATHSNDNALTRDVWKHVASRFFIKRNLGDHSIVLWNDGTLTTKQIGRDVIAISVVAQNGLRRVRACGGRSTMCYEEGDHAIELHATDMSDAWLAALLYHEMGHALRYKQGEALGVTTQSDAAWVAEEVEMHTLENVVLDAATGGKARAQYAAMAASRPGMPAQSQSLCKGISKEEAYSFFLTLDMRGDTAGAFAQLCLSIGFTMLERQGRGSVEDKAHFYGAITR